jgi:hypothetical protein
MARLTAGYAQELAKFDDVVVNTGPRNIIGLPLPYEVKGLFRDDFARDSAALAGETVDAWLALNGGLTPLAERLESPFFLYLHGSDFLNPWISYGSHWMEALQKPYMAVVRKSLRRAALRRTIGGVAYVFANSARTSGVLCFLT